MTDRELLVKAAKAADINIKMDRFDADDQFIGFIVGARNTNQRSAWNPLTDDGDALRLAVKLGIGAQSYAALGYSHAGAESVMRSVVIKEPHNDDPCASTRCAIVRAAATIGASK